MRLAGVPCKIATDASFPYFPVAGPPPLFPHIATQATFDPRGKLTEHLLVIGVVEVLPPALQVFRHLPDNLFYSSPSVAARQFADALLQPPDALVTDKHPACLSNAEPKEGAVAGLINPALTLVRFEFQFLGQEVADGLQDSASRSLLT